MKSKSRFQNLSFWEKFGVAAGLASIVGLVITIYMLVAPTSDETPYTTSISTAGDASPAVNARGNVAIGASPLAASGSSLEKGRQSPELVKMESKGDNSPVVNASGDVVILQPTQPAIQTYLRDSNDKSMVTLYKSATYTQQNNPERILAEIPNGSVVTVFRTAIEVLNRDDIVDQAFNGLKLVRWTKVRIEEGSAKGMVGWVFSSDVQER